MMLQFDHTKASFASFSEPLLSVFPHTFENSRRYYRLVLECTTYKTLNDPLLAWCFRGFFFLSVKPICDFIVYDYSFIYGTVRVHIIFVSFSSECSVTFYYWHPLWTAMSGLSFNYFTSIFSWHTARPWERTCSHYPHGSEDQ